MKITRRQLRKIIKEAIDVMDSSTGELLVFDDEAASDSGLARPDAPEAAALDIRTTDAFSKRRPVDRTTLKDVFKF